MVEIVTLEDKKNRKRSAINIAATLLALFTATIMLLSDIMFDVGYKMDTYLIILVMSFYFWVFKFEKVNK